MTGAGCTDQDSDWTIVLGAGGHCRDFIAQQNNHG